jgi:hypothetical protein
MLGSILHACVLFGLPYEWRAGSPSIDRLAGRGTCAVPVMRPPDPTSCHPEEGRRRVSLGCWSRVTWGSARRGSCAVRAQGDTEALRSFVAQGDRTGGRAEREPCNALARGSTEALRSFVAQGDRVGGRAGYGTCVAWDLRGVYRALCLSCALPIPRPVTLRRDDEGSRWGAGPA